MSETIRSNEPSRTLCHVHLCGRSRICCPTTQRSLLASHRIPYTRRRTPRVRIASLAMEGLHHANVRCNTVRMCFSIHLSPSFRLRSRSTVANPFRFLLQPKSRSTPLYITIARFHSSCTMYTYMAFIQRRGQDFPFIGLNLAGNSSGFPPTPPSDLTP